MRAKQRLFFLKRGQNALEFLVVTFIVLFFFILVLVVLAQRLDSAQISRSESELQQIIDIVQTELLIARSVPGNYIRNFTLPEEVSERNYSLSLVNGKELVIVDDFGKLVTFLPFYVYGELDVGSNTIIKQGPIVGICSSQCDFEYVFNATGTLQCGYGGGEWTPCDFTYGDYIKHFRVDCASVSNAHLTITNMDDSLIYFDDSSSVSSGGYFSFQDVNLMINGSGYWSVEVGCGVSEPLTTLFYVPYGSYSFKPLNIDSSCTFDDNLYSCVANENFTLRARVECVGGECGDTSIWVDP